MVDRIANVTFTPGEIYNFSELGAQKEKVRDIPVMLICPPDKGLSDQAFYPALGPLKVAGELTANGNRVLYLDLPGHLNYQEIVALAIRENPDVNTFGITVVTSHLNTATELIDVIRTEKPDAKIIVGGPHVTATFISKRKDEQSGKEGLGTAFFDHLRSYGVTMVAGDGENAIFYAIDPDYSSDLINSADRVSPFFMQKGSVDDYAPPERMLLDEDRYHGNVDGMKAMTVISQLGCPFGCEFCGMRDVDAFRMARPRTVEHLMKEIKDTFWRSVERAVNSLKSGEALIEAYSAIMDYADEINILFKSFTDYMEGIVEFRKEVPKIFAAKYPGLKLEDIGLQTETVDGQEALKMRLRAFLRSDLLIKHPEQAQLMFRAGFRNVLLGIESGSDRMLNSMNKGTNREMNEKAVRILHDAGISIKHLLSVGHAGESGEDIEKTWDYVVKCVVTGQTVVVDGQTVEINDEFDITAISPYPGSIIADEAVYVPEQQAYRYENKRGDVLWISPNIIDIYLKQGGHYKAKAGQLKNRLLTWTPFLSSEQIMQWREYIEREGRKLKGLPPISSLNIPAQHYEHSMGQRLPEYILRQSSSPYGEIYNQSESN